MAELTAEQRTEVRAELMRELSAIWEGTGGLVKPDMLAAVNGLDTWLNDNAAAANNAIPQPARSGLTTAQKARLMKLVITWRYIVGA